VTASTVIALASLGVAGLTVLVTYLNVRRQADATAALEHAKWLREKQAELYDRLIEVFLEAQWIPRPAPDDPRWAELDAMMRRALQYASGAVLADAQAPADDLKRERHLPLARKLLVTMKLVRHIRAELVGEREAQKTWARYEARANEAP
jgi:hypothetical protein